MDIKMLIKYVQLTFLLMIAVLLLVGSNNCTGPVTGIAVIGDIICASEVPVSFETPLVYKTSGEKDGSVLYKWFSDNGTLKGDGDSVMWTAPSEPGTYEVGVRVTDKKGLETERVVSVEVVPFGRTILDSDPAILTEIPIWGNYVIYDKLLIAPLALVEIACKPPPAILGKQEYVWSCNGGKLRGTGVKEGTASTIGWSSPGVPGNYTVKVTVSDSWGNQRLFCTYIGVINPACCDGNEVCGGQ